MLNDVFRASDAVLVLGVDDPSAPEGAAANGLVEQYNLTNAVGRLRNVTVSVSTDVQAFYEIGKRYPTHSVPASFRYPAQPNAPTSTARCCACCLAMGPSARRPVGILSSPLSTSSLRSKTRPTPAKNVR